MCDGGRSMLHVPINGRFANRPYTYDHPFGGFRTFVFGFHTFVFGFRTFLKDRCFPMLREKRSLRKRPWMWVRAGCLWDEQESFTSPSNERIFSKNGTPPTKKEASLFKKQVRWVVAHFSFLGKELHLCTFGACVCTFGKSVHLYASRVPPTPLAERAQVLWASW